MGEWFKGYQHGKGKEIWPDKRVITGIWENGKRVKLIEQVHIN